MFQYQRVLSTDLCKVNLLTDISTAPPTPTAMHRDTLFFQVSKFAFAARPQKKKSENLALSASLLFLAEQSVSDFHDLFSRIMTRKLHACLTISAHLFANFHDNSGNFVHGAEHM